MHEGLCLILAAFVMGCGSDDTPSNPSTGMDASVDGVEDAVTETEKEGSPAVAPVCEEGQTLCSEECVDLNQNSWHCGQCDTPCSNGFYCFDSKCQCSPGTKACGESCVDVHSDPLHCGSCDTACPTHPNMTASCVEDTCALACWSNYEDCDLDPENGCEISLNLEDNCGACGVICPGTSCVSGFCNSIVIDNGSLNGFGLLTGHGESLFWVKWDPSGADEPAYILHGQEERCLARQSNGH